MLLEMYLDGQMVDITTVVPFLWQTKPGEYVKNLVAELEKKHADLLKKSLDKPCYCLNGVPSCINNFTPLRHPAASAPPIQNNENTVRSPAEIPLNLVENMTEAESPAVVEKMPRHQSGKVA
jgi:hypothetical protein